MRKIIVVEGQETESDHATPRHTAPHHATPHHATPHHTTPRLTTPHTPMRRDTLPLTGIQVLIKQGDKADLFYIAESGSYEVYQAPPDSEDAALVHIYVADPEHGTCPSFGELALLYAKPRKATVVAASTGVVWALDRAGFRLAHSWSGKHDLTKVLGGMPIMSSLAIGQLQDVRDAMTEVSFEQGETVVKQGEVGNSMFLILSGTVRCFPSAPLISAYLGFFPSASRLLFFTTSSNHHFPTSPPVLTSS